MRLAHDLAPMVVVAAAAAAWRFAPGPAAWALSALAVAGALAIGLKTPEAGPRSAWWVLTLAALLAALPLVPGGWPCEVACGGGGAYRRVLGVPVLAPAAALYAIAAWSAARRRRAPRTAAATQRWLWLACGASFYLIGVAIALRLACGHCLAVHGAVLAAAALAVRGALAWRARLALAAFAALALHAAYHPELRLDREEPAPTRPAATDVVARARAIDENRCLGRADAPRRLELGIDFQCPHCAAIHADLVAAVRGEADAGRLRIVTRHVVRRSEPASRALVRWALAAAAVGRDQYRAYLAAMLGSREGATLDALRDRAGEIVDMPAIERALAADGAAIDQVLALDAARLAELDPQARTPVVALVDARTGRVLKAWDGEVVVAEVAAALRATF